MSQLFRCGEETMALAAQRGLLNSSLASSEVIVSYDKKKVKPAQQRLQQLDKFPRRDWWGISWLSI